ncbi:tetratricopeptide repeat protein [Novipirellula rosea]
MPQTSIVRIDSSRSKKWGVSLLIAVAAAMLVILCFAPRFKLWQSFDLPEVDRYYDTLRQLENPFEDITNHVSRVNQWRLFFPFVGNLTGLSEWQFTTIPFLGCIATLFYIVILCQRAGMPIRDSLLLSTLLAMSPWYFVSTGWLAYFDSWVVFFMLVAAFSQNRIAVVTACLIAPWIDERFVLALPVLLVVRATWNDRIKAHPGAMSTMIPLIGIATSVYLVIRLIALATGTDPVAHTYAREHLALIQSIPITNLLWGVWFGHRIAWLFCIYFLYHCFKTYRRATFAVYSLAILLTTVGALVIAGDMHRSLEMLFPVCLAGALLSRDLLPSRFTYALAAAVVLSAILPARHQLWQESYPIHSLAYELQRERPSTSERVHAGIGRSSHMAAEGDFAGAMLIANKVLEIDQRAIEPRLHRAQLLASTGNFDLAEQDLVAASELNPSSADAAFFYGSMALQHGRYATALAKFQEALRLGGEDWPNRADCQAAVHLLTRPPEE